MQKGLHERAVEAVARTRAAGRSQEYRVVDEIRAGRSPVLVVQGADGDRLAVKLVQVTAGGQLPTCPVAFPPEAVNIFPVLDVFAWEEGYGLVMPVAERSLRQWLRNDDCCEIEELFSVLRDVAAALASIEGRMVHGDLKPENILHHGGAWCLADFGPSACRLSAKERQEYSLTPAYAAPEQWHARSLTSRTDIYAFGVIAFELLNGIRPFAGPTADDFRLQHVFQTAPPLLGMPASLASLVAQCLRKNPAERPTAARVRAFFEPRLPSMMGPKASLTPLGYEENAGMTVPLVP